MRAFGEAVKHAGGRNSQIREAGSSLGDALEAFILEHEYSRSTRRGGALSMTPWSWLLASPWRCPRCSHTIVTREAGPRCSSCP